MKGDFSLEGAYRRTPVALQNLQVSAVGWWTNRGRYGGGYRRIAQTVGSQQALTGAALIDYQCKRLGAHLRAAAATPFWQRRFEECGVDPAAADSRRELAKLPTIDKATVKVNLSELRNPALQGGRLANVHTSGTTGSGLVFWETRESEWERWATWWRYRERFGLTRTTWCGYFGGRGVVPRAQTRPPFWRRNLPARQVLFSAYHLSEATVADYWAELCRRQVPWLHGYPSMLHALASLAERAQLPPLAGVRCITTGAENLLANQRAVIERVFGCRVRQHYGLAEAVANMSEWQDGRMRVDEDFAYVEFVPIPQWPGQFRIVGTNWANPAVPLLRYDTGDVASLEPGVSMSPDGTWRPVAAVDGRQEDTVVLPSGALVGRLDHIFKDMTAIREARILQPRRDKLVFEIVQEPDFRTGRDDVRLLREARLRLGEEIAIELAYVAALPRTHTGKLRFVVSQISELGVT